MKDNELLLLSIIIEHLLTLKRNNWIVIRSDRILHLYYDIYVL